MKKMFFCVAIALITNASTFADTRERVITITTDAFDGTFAIDVVRNSSGAATQMYYQTPDNPNGLLTLSQLQSGPQVIFTRKGHKVILLSLESDFNASKGGHMVVRYLNNGATDAYKDFRVLVDFEKNVILRSDPDSNDPDSDENSYSGVFNQLFMAKNTVFGIVVGVDHVEPSYH